MARVAVLRCCTETRKGRSSVRNRPLAWVELRGFEPLTPSMRTRCATRLRYSPENLSQRSKLCRLLVPRTQLPRHAVKALASVGYLRYPVRSARMEYSMSMVKTLIEIDEEALATAAEVLGTKTKKDTVNAALREVGQRLVRLQALARLGEMADRGDFDEFVGNKSAYRR